MAQGSEQVDPEAFLRTRVRAVYALQVPMIGMDVLGSCLIAWCYWSPASAHLLGLWLAVSFAILIPRITLALGYRHGRLAHLPPRFGFDAIRIPLYLVWGREATGSRLAAMMKFWGGFTDKPMPAWVDVTDGTLAPFAAPSGFYAVVDLARGRLRAQPPPLPQIGDGDDYYSASLILLAGLARRAVER